MSQHPRAVLLAAAVVTAVTATDLGGPPWIQGSPAAETAHAQSTAPGQPTGLHVADQDGQALTLAWTPPLEGPPPTGYLIEAGVESGVMAASLPISDAPRITLAAPIGVFYVRLRALADTLPGPASDEIRVVVGTGAAPSAPAHLLGAVDGSTLTISWTNTFTGGAPARWWLNVGGSAAAVLPLSGGETVTFTGVPPGRYTLSVMTANASGLSEPSNTIELEVPARCDGVPGAPTNFRAWRAGSMLHVSWSPPTSGAAVASYSVEVTGAIVAGLETTARAVSGEVGPGAYVVSVSANNACGRGPAAPDTPEWTSVVRQADTHAVHWAPTPAATGYRVYWATTRLALEAADANVPFVDVAAPSLAVPAADSTQPLYYRVHTLHGPVAGPGGPVAVAPGFEQIDYFEWPGNVSPSLWDLNGDGCLDLLGAWGACDGTFRRYALTDLGLDGLMANGRIGINRDSRFADFTGDGITDILTNVYTEAYNLPHATMLHVGDSQGRFTENPHLTAMQIRGFGETVVAADFDNDGDLDAFIPHYTHRQDGGHNWLLINDGTGRFVDLAERAGVALNVPYPPEGAQALDFNEDGWIDLYVASALYINNGDLTFTNLGHAAGVPVLFDEGVRLSDVDLDGDFDLLHHDTHVTRLFTNRGGRFEDPVAIHGDPLHSTFGYGLNACDVNMDGFEDVIVAHNRVVGRRGQPRLLLNVGGTFIESELPRTTDVYNDLVSCADLDRSGLPDLVGRWGEAHPGLPYALFRFRNYISRGTPRDPIRLRILGESGRMNQQGRVVRIRPIGGPDRTLLRAVDSGSGLMAQNGYDLAVAAPWPVEYEISVRFASGWIRTRARSGDALVIHEGGLITAGMN